MHLHALEFCRQQLVHLSDVDSDDPGIEIMSTEISCMAKLSNNRDSMHAGNFNVFGLLPTAVPAICRCTRLAGNVIRTSTLPSLKSHRTGSLYH